MTQLNVYLLEVVDIDRDDAQRPILHPKEKYQTTSERRLTKEQWPILTGPFRKRHPSNGGLPVGGRNELALPEVTIGGVDVPRLAAARRKSSRRKN